MSLLDEAGEGGEDVFEVGGGEVVVGGDDLFVVPEEGPILLVVVDPGLFLVGVEVGDGFYLADQCGRRRDGGALENIGADVLTADTLPR